jgi:hypothetical protein
MVRMRVLLHHVINLRNDRVGTPVPNTGSPNGALMQQNVHL